MIAFAYYHQVLYPTSAANFQRTPAVPLGAHPHHYNRPYDAEYAAPQYAPYPAPQYAPPPGPPPSDMGYGVGMGANVGGARDLKDADAKDDDGASKFDDPFADFDAPSKPAGSSHPPAH